jgi:hypothetical protein
MTQALRDFLEDVFAAVDTKPVSTNSTPDLSAQTVKVVVRY